MSMKIASTISRYLLGLIFLTFGFNGFLHFIPMPPPMGVAAQFFATLFVSGFYVVIFFLQIVPAVLLLVNRLRATGSHDSRCRHREHTLLSHFHGACGLAAGCGGYGLVVCYSFECAVRIYGNRLTLSKC